MVEFPQVQLGQCRKVTGRVRFFLGCLLPGTLVLVALSGNDRGGLGSRKQVVASG
jgi:hypothetical protein